MTGYLGIATVVSGLVWLLPAMPPPARDAAADASQVTRRTLQWPSSASTRALEVSNLNGAVRIVGENRTDVSVVATRTVTRQGADGDAGPVPDFKQGAETLLVCGDSRRCGCHLDMPPDRSRWSEDRTRVRLDLELHVPRTVTLDVCAVNGRAVRVEGTAGPFAIGNVNGDVELVDVSGSGRASTVNGDVTAALNAAPRESSAFRTVNGRVVLTLPPTLSADLRLRTLHGGIYTDFDTTALPQRPTAERRDGRFVYRSDRYASVRVGTGGPELRVETVNGDIQVRKK